MSLNNGLLPFMPLKRWTILLAVFLFGLHGAYLLSFPVSEYLARFAIGDALVYARVAFNVASGRGSTYDLDTLTNGYHPLWMWLHIPFFVHADNILDRFNALRILWIIAAGLAASAWSLVIWRITQNALAALVMFLLLSVSPYSTFVLYSGLETSLVILMCGALVYWLINQASSPTRGQSFVFGLLVAGTFLARLDSLIVIAPLLLSSAAAWKNIVPKRILFSALGFFAPVLPYLSWNFKNFGSILPVSGQVKTLPGVDWQRSFGVLSNWLQEFSRLSGFHVGAGLLALGATLAFGLGALFLLRLWREKPAAALLLATLGCGAAGHYLYYLLFMRELNVPWHVYPQFLAFCLFIVLAFDSCAKLLEARQEMALGICCLLLAVSWYYYDSLKAKRRDEARALIALAPWFVDHVPAGSRISMYDSFLLAAYLPAYHVSDLNGLVGNRELALLAKEKAVDAAIRVAQAQYVIAREPADCPIVEQSARLMYRSALVATTTKYRLVVASSQVFIETWRANQDTMCFDKSA